MTLNYKVCVKDLNVDMICALEYDLLSSTNDKVHVLQKGTSEQ